MDALLKEFANYKPGQAIHEAQERFNNKIKGAVAEKQAKKEQSVKENYGTKTTGGKKNTSNAQFHSDAPPEQPVMLYKPKEAGVTPSRQIAPTNTEPVGLIQIANRYSDNSEQSGLGFLYSDGNKRIVVTCAHVMGVSKDKRDLLSTITINQLKTMTDEKGNIRRTPVTKAFNKSEIRVIGCADDVIFFELCNTSKIADFQCLKRAITVDNAETWDQARYYSFTGDNITPINTKCYKTDRNPKISQGTLTTYTKKGDSGAPIFKVDDNQIHQVVGLYRGKFTKNQNQGLAVLFTDHLVKTLGLPKRDSATKN